MKIRQCYLDFLVKVCMAIFLILTSCTKMYEKNNDQDILRQQDSISVWISWAKDTVFPAKEDLLNKAYRAVVRLPKDTVKAKHLLNLSYRYYQTNDTAMFRKVNKETIQLTKQLGDSSGLAAAYWDLGDYHSDILYKRDSGSYYYAKAQRVYESMGKDFSSAQMLINMAVEQIAIKDYTGSEVHTSKAIILLKPLKKYRQLYSCYNNLGIIFNNLGNHDKALMYYNQALEYLKRINMNDKNTLSLIILNNMGGVYKNQEKYKEAIEKYEEAQLINELYPQNLEFNASIINNIAYAKFKMGDTTELPDMFYDALRIRDSLNIKQDIITSKLNLAEYYAVYNDTLNALKNADQARKLAESSKNFANLLSSLLLLSKLEKPEKSITHLYTYISLIDSLQLAERNLREKYTRIRFETDELISKNIKIHKERNIIFFASVSILSTVLLMSSMAVGYYRRKQRKYQARFKALLEEKGQPKTKSGGATVEALNISEKAINNITEKLKVFIEEKQFLSNNISLNELAKTMDTNPNYLSRFINFYEQKSFSTYIRDMRINYAVEELKINAVFRKYSIKAIAEEIGFNNEQSFSKAFYRKTGIYPSYFIRELEKEVLKTRSA